MNETEPRVASGAAPCRLSASPLTARQTLAVTELLRVSVSSSVEQDGVNPWSRRLLIDAK